MTKNLELGDISAELFLQNISNLPGIMISFTMINIEYVGHEDSREIIDHAKGQFLIFCKRITNEIEAMTAWNKKYQPSLDYEELLSVKKLVNSLDLSFSKLLQITKEKIDEMIIFVLAIEKHATKIELSEYDKMQIRGEVFITRHRLKL